MTLEATDSCHRNAGIRRIPSARSLDRELPAGSPRFQKDWALSVRYDYTPWLYLKFEQPIMDGTEFGYSALDNTTGLSPNARMTFLKLGTSF